jgi:hypothetical protein
MRPRRDAIAFRRGPVARVALCRSVLGHRERGRFSVKLVAGARIRRNRPFAGTPRWLKENRLLCRLTPVFPARGWPAEVGLGTAGAPEP